MKGQIHIGTLITVAGLVASSIIWVVSYVGSNVTPIKAQAEQNTVDIATMKDDISWIKQALQARGFRPSESSSTYGN